MSDRVVLDVPDSAEEGAVVNAVVTVTNDLGYRNWFRLFLAADVTVEGEFELIADTDLMIDAGDSASLTGSFTMPARDVSVTGSCLYWSGAPDWDEYGWDSKVVSMVAAPPPPPETFHLEVNVPSWAAGGYIDPGSGDYAAYSTVELTAYPLPGYQFTGWAGDASGTDPTYSLYMDSDKYVEAYFERVPVPPPETFHLEVNVPPWAAGGYIDPGSGDYAAHSTVELTAYPLPGYQFTGWGGDASGTDPTYSLYMDDDKYVEAYFEEVLVPVFVGRITRKELDYDAVRVPFPVS
ncbi:hypothetical protein ES703_79806 [subsurface metagenome]